MTESRVLRVPDMSCGHCVLSVQEALGELEGVEGADADHTRGEVELTYDAGKVTEEDLRGPSRRPVTRCNARLRQA